MNKAKLKTYAPQARKDFIAAVTARAHRLGLSERDGQLQIAPAEINGDLVLIAGQSWPAKISRQRDNLIVLMQKHGFAQTLENVAYTWFNRFAALRYMEIHDYLKHGYRVLSSRAGGLPEILSHAPELAQQGDLPGLNPQKAIELKLAGDQDGGLYRLTLIAQCNALSNAMPFLFERIDDETELLLPDNLLLTDSIIAKLVTAIPEEDWNQVEIIGWLYQFYISEKKDQVIGKVVKSEDIPAATQLFTPNWIVKYLVQNSVGRLWQMTNPASTLKKDWHYYIEPAEQTPEVQAQLDALIQARMVDDGGSLNPETITVLDPACGSGHILVEAYDVLKAIYLDRGYQSRNIPRLILEKNLFGLDIDDRAAQLAGFALLMKARADDRRLLDNPPQLNVLALQESEGLDIDDLDQALSGYAALTRPAVASLLETFAHAKTFGSLIQIPPQLSVQLAAIEEALQQALQSGDLFTQAAAFDLLPLVRQAKILGMRFDAVVANPPYMGNGAMTSLLKEFVGKNYPSAAGDCATCFVLRNIGLAGSGGQVGLITFQNWMFVSSFSQFREQIFESSVITSLVHNGRGVWGADFGSCAFCLSTGTSIDTVGTFIKLFEKSSLVQSNEQLQARFINRSPNNVFIRKSSSFGRVPGIPIAYWISDSLADTFVDYPPISTTVTAKTGLSSGAKELFCRRWFEVSHKKIHFRAKSSDVFNSDYSERFDWAPLVSGGKFRKWFGNFDEVIRWTDDGKEIRAFNGSTVRNPGFYFKQGITWSDVTISTISFRFVPYGFVFSDVGPMAFSNAEENILVALALGNSVYVDKVAKALNPTIHFKTGDFARIPYVRPKELDITSIHQCINIARDDWDNFETSWDFSVFPLIRHRTENKLLQECWDKWDNKTRRAIAELKILEDLNNRLFIEAFGLQDELSPNISEDQITLARADREKDCQRLISYAIGCMMGRYSLDEPGLIYAHSGNIGFDSTRYKSFPTDADGIVPVTDELWFEDDAANRIREFLLAVWGAETLDENLAWLAESLGQKTGETSDETIRRYLAGSFFKDHLQTYKKRPIYWLFSSGKQGAFQALVYLHRYHEGTLARMRAEYVVPLTGKIQSRIEMLQKDAAAAASNAARNKLNKDIERLKKKHVELLAYDEKLRHYADLRIQLDLDDGVKVNYGKFGDLLAEVKVVTGGKDE